MPDAGTFTTNTSVQTSLEGGNPYVTLMAKGNWGGATVFIEAGDYFGSNPAVLDWVTVNDSSLAANGAISIAVVAQFLRVTCIGGTGHSIKWALR